MFNSLNRLGTDHGTDMAIATPLYVDKLNIIVMKILCETI